MVRKLVVLMGLVCTVACGGTEGIGQQQLGIDGYWEGGWVMEDGRFNGTMTVSLTQTGVDFQGNATVDGIPVIQRLQGAVSAKLKQGLIGGTIKMSLGQLDFNVQVTADKSSLVGTFTLVGVGPGKFTLKRLNNAP